MVKQPFFAGTKVTSMKVVELHFSWYIARTRRQRYDVYIYNVHVYIYMLWILKQYQSAILYNDIYIKNSYCQWSILLWFFPHARPRDPQSLEAATWHPTPDFRLQLADLPWFTELKDGDVPLRLQCKRLPDWVTWFKWGPGFLGIHNFHYSFLGDRFLGTQ